MAKQTSFRRNVLAAGGIALALSFLPLFASGAAADRIIDGPIHLGGADSYGVLGASAVTNTGPTVVSGDVGVSPQSSVTGFDGPPGGLIVDGTLHQTDAHAAQAQNDTATAYDVAASLTPTSSGIAELNGLSLSPGVYSGGALVLSDNGALVLAGDAESVWVFQAASTLTIGSATSIIITGGASACNVFWQVGSSATLGISAQFQGTVLADQSITATTGATVTGRLLARTGAVTMDTNSVSAPRSCPPSGTPVDTTPPVITSGAFPPGCCGHPLRLHDHRDGIAVADIHGDLRGAPARTEPRRRHGRDLGHTDLTGRVAVHRDRRERGLPRSLGRLCAHHHGRGIAAGDRDRECADPAGDGGHRTVIIIPPGRRGFGGGFRIPAVRGGPRAVPCERW